MPETDPTEAVKVAKDLTAILELTHALGDQAIHKANDREYLPGGSAMVALAPVANLEAWEHIYEAGESTGRDVSHVIDEDEDSAPPLQLLLFWSEAWRVEHNRESDRRPTVASEANFIRQCLDWAWENEYHWDDFTKDVNRARRILEDVLYAGRRAERTAIPCVVSTCERKPRLIRTYDDHDVTGVSDGYKCPGCKTRYDHAAFVRAKFLLLASQGADRHVKMQDARDAIDRSERTFRKWLRYWYVRSYIDPSTGQVWVWWPDVREADLETPRRRVA